MSLTSHTVGPSSARASPARRRHAQRRVTAKSSPQEAWIERKLGSEVIETKSLGGSQWASFSSHTLKDGREVFVKTSGKGPEMFQGEAAGLRALRAAGGFVVPEVYGAGVLESATARSDSFIAMEFLNIGGRGDQGNFGDALARMHLAEPSHEEAKKGMFGFEVNNTIGETRQPNEWTDGWLEFWRDKRLMHMINLSRDAKLRELAEKVADKRLPEMLRAAGDVKPSLLHGDLWSGNIGTVASKPSVFDPAVYYGHHEAEFGMSWCASFSPAFWEAYHAKIPKADGFDERAKMYKLYHYLNHYVMFGGGYYGQCVSILKELA